MGEILLPSSKVGLGINELMNHEKVYLACVKYSVNVGFRPVKWLPGDRCLPPSLTTIQTLDTLGGSRESIPSGSPLTFSHWHIMSKSVITVSC